MAKANYEFNSDNGEGFSPLFPSSTGRDGRVRPNSAKTGNGQGRGSPRRMIHCKQCGYVFDRNKTDVSGGSENGDGGLEDVQTTSVSYTVGGETHTDVFANVRGVGEGSGCPQCGSKNGASK